VLQAAYEKNPERFVNGPPKPPEIPVEVWITPPRKSAQNTNEAIVVITEAVDPDGNSEGNGELSASPQQIFKEIVEASPVDTGIIVKILNRVVSNH
jgi:hypothetical protein